MILRLSRFTLILLAGAGLLLGIWAGWLRLGWALPTIQPTLPVTHGPLMIAGFLGTLISLERAVALGRTWMYLAPLSAGLGALLVLAFPLTAVGVAGISISSLLTTAIFAHILRRHTTLDTITMSLGAFAWLGGNLLWLSGMPLFQIVPWWSTFLVLTIAGERLELGRIQRLPPYAERTFAGLISMTVLALFIALLSGQFGVRLYGIALLGLAIWLLRFDIARKTIHQSGLPRFAAACLLGGYAWLAVGGAIWLVAGPQIAGVLYDAAIHTVMVGFVFAMIFGHAPIIFPAVLGLPINYRPIFYSHLALLHLSLIVRVSGDLLGIGVLRSWGGLFNGLAILLFLFNTLTTILTGRERQAA